MAFKLTRRHLWEFYREKKDENEQREYLRQYVFAVLKITDDEIGYGGDVARTLSTFHTRAEERWRDSSRYKARFLKNNAHWLDEEIKLPERTSTAPKGGRPEKDFETSSRRSKRRKTEEVRKSMGTPELSYATHMKLRSSGNEPAAKLLNEIANTTPSRAAKISEAWKEKQSRSNMKPYTPEEALSLFIELQLTKDKYNLLRLRAKEHGVYIYPSYKKIMRAKEKCYPNQEAIRVTENIGEIKVQDLVDHTTDRLIALQDQVISALPASGDEVHLVLLSKWGFDGASDMSNYKQVWQDEESGVDSSDDSSLFVTSLVPLQLVSESCEEQKTIVWQNPRPSSTRYCRPIRFQFMKETAARSVAEKKYIESQIASLSPSCCKTSDGKTVLVTHKMILTMVDGKVCSAITGTAASNCFVCGAKPTDMNNLEKVRTRVPNMETFNFGLSTLHAWIRGFECMLHIAYRIDVKKWRIAKPDDKISVATRKKNIQDRLRQEMGLLVDIPRHGSGTSNDGNTARRFFEDPALSATITGIDVTLIHRFSVILRTLSCGYEVDAEKFGEYALGTANLYVSLYPWYYMPSSIHKILIHGTDIVSAALLPIGQLSEEAQEGRNKDCRNYRERFARKCSRSACNRDLLNRLLITSDPVISSMRKTPSHPKGSLHADVLQLLQTPA